MMTLEIDDDTARLLNQLMEREHTNAAQLVKQALVDYLGAKQAGRPAAGTDGRHYRHASQLAHLKGIKI